MKFSFKNIISVLVVLLLLFAAFFASYKITVAVRNKNNVSVTQSDVSAAQTGTNTESTVDAQNTTDAQSSTASYESTLPATEGTSDEETLVTAPAGDEVLPTPTVINMPTDDSWCTVLLNRYYKMNDSYEPFLSEVISGSNIFLDERVADKFFEMYNAALTDGVTLTPASGYVSADRQTRNFEKQCELYTAQGFTAQKAEAAAAFTVMPTGCSEHNYGLAIDIGWKSQSFADSPAYAWLQAHAETYGFIERYKSDKENITHFGAAPYHWRYVGTAAASAINAGGYCLEEYLGKIN